MGSKVIGCGHYLPKHIIKNDDFDKSIETSDEWIRQRTGIEQRFIAAKDEVTSDLGAKAALEAIEKAGLEPKDIDLIICATSTPDTTFPATAIHIQNKIGIKRAAAFDVQAVCSGFIYALAVADNFLRLGQHKRALVIGAETLSRIMNWKDRSTCVLFGDGAGAFLLEARNGDNIGVLTTKIYSDGESSELLYVDGGVSSTGKSGYIKMNGREVFRHAVEKMGKALEEVTRNAGYKLNDLDWIVPHQANKRIMIAIADKYKLPFDRMIVDVDKHANTSSATIPLAIYGALEEGKIKEGDLIGLTALGAGLTWGGAVIRW